MDRRSFLTWVGVGWLASSLPIAIASCTPTGEETSNSQPPSPVPTRPDGFAVVGTLPQLREKGYLQSNIAGKTVFVLSDRTTPDKVLALDAACTHKGCPVEWNSAQSEFICPCHDSKFAADAKVLAGPAKEPLKTYESKIEDDSILVKVS